MLGFLKVFPGRTRSEISFSSPFTLVLLEKGNPIETSLIYNLFLAFAENNEQHVVYNMSYALVQMFTLNSLKKSRFDLFRYIQM